MGFRFLAVLACGFYSNSVVYVHYFFPKGGFLNPISTNCVKRLTSNSSGLLTLRDFSLNLVLVFKAQWFGLGVLHYQPLNWALCAQAKNQVMR